MQFELNLMIKTVAQTAKTTKPVTCQIGMQRCLNFSEKTSQKFCYFI